jgi:outer membrane protein assembly factor BamD (BamD/ComL family)
VAPPVAPPPVAPPPVAAAPSVEAPRRTPRAETSIDDLAAERALLDEVRADLSGGRLDAAQSALRRHYAEFPGAQLAEEREFLSIRLRAAQGDVEGAAARRERFRRRYPSSLYLQALESGAPSISP